MPSAVNQNVHWKRDPFDAGREDIERIVAADQRDTAGLDPWRHRRMEAGRVLCNDPRTDLVTPGPATGANEDGVSGSDLMRGSVKILEGHSRSFVGNVLDELTANAFSTSALEDNRSCRNDFHSRHWREKIMTDTPTLLQDEHQCPFLAPIFAPRGVISASVLTVDRKSCNHEPRSPAITIELGKR